MERRSPARAIVTRDRANGQTFRSRWVTRDRANGQTFRCLPAPGPQRNTPSRYSFHIRPQRKMSGQRRTRSGITTSRPACRDSFQAM